MDKSILINITEVDVHAEFVERSNLCQDCGCKIKIIKVGLTCTVHVLSLLLQNKKKFSSSQVSRAYLRAFWNILTTSIAPECLEGTSPTENVHIDLLLGCIYCVWSKKYLFPLHFNAVHVTSSKKILWFFVHCAGSLIEICKWWLLRHTALNGNLL